MPIVQNMEEKYDRVEDVYNGMEEYGAMIAMIFHLSGQNPMIPIVSAGFMAKLIDKLCQWDVLTPDEYERLMFRIREGNAERIASIEARENGEEPKDLIHDLLGKVGI